jgi:hypothetical protein
MKTKLIVFLCVILATSQMANNTRAQSAPAKRHIVEVQRATPTPTASICTLGEDTPTKQQWDWPIITGKDKGVWPRAIVAGEKIAEIGQAKKPNSDDVWDMHLKYGVAESATKGRPICAIWPWNGMRLTFNSSEEEVIAYIEKDLCWTVVAIQFFKGGDGFDPDKNGYRFSTLAAVIYTVK